MAEKTFLEDIYDNKLCINSFPKGRGNVVAEGWLDHYYSIADVLNENTKKTESHFLRIAPNKKTALLNQTNTNVSEEDKLNNIPIQCITSNLDKSKLLIYQDTISIVSCKPELKFVAKLDEKYTKPKPISSGSEQKQLLPFLHVEWSNFSPNIFGLLSRKDNKNSIIYIFDITKQENGVIRNAEKSFNVGNTVCFTFGGGSNPWMKYCIFIATDVGIKVIKDIAPIGTEIDTTTYSLMHASLNQQYKQELKNSVHCKGSCYVLIKNQIHTKSHDSKNEKSKEEFIVKIKNVMSMLMEDKYLIVATSENINIYQIPEATLWESDPNMSLAYSFFGRNKLEVIINKDQKKCSNYYPIITRSGGVYVIDDPNIYSIKNGKIYHVGEYKGVCGVGGAYRGTKPSPHDGRPLLQGVPAFAVTTEGKICPLANSSSMENCFSSEPDKAKVEASFKKLSARLKELESHRSELIAKQQKVKDTADELLKGLKEVSASFGDSMNEHSSGVSESGKYFENAGALVAIARQLMERAGLPEAAELPTAASLGKPSEPTPGADLLEALESDQRVLEKSEAELFEAIEKAEKRLEEVSKGEIKAALPERYSQETAPVEGDNKQEETKKPNDDVTNRSAQEEKKIIPSSEQALIKRTSGSAGKSDTGKLEEILKNIKHDDILSQAEIDEAIVKIIAKGDVDEDRARQILEATKQIGSIETKLTVLESYCQF